METHARTKRALRRLAVVVVAVGCLAGVTATSTAVGATTRPPAAGTTHYYVALGDSTSVGVTPTSGDSDRGYGERITTVLAQRDPRLRLVKLGCGGETTTTMILGDHVGTTACIEPSGRSTYPEGSQLGAAVHFLLTHPGKVDLITIGIGGNDYLDADCRGDAVCLANVDAQVHRNLSVVLFWLRMVAPRTTIVGLDYYNPGLVGWFGDAQTIAAGLETTAGARHLDQTLAATYAAFRVPVAPISEAFSAFDFDHFVDVAGFGSVPIGSLKLCQWTGQCFFGDVHPNEDGYQVMADTVLATLASLPRWQR